MLGGVFYRFKFEATHVYPYELQIGQKQFAFLRSHQSFLSFHQTLHLPVLPQPVRQASVSPQRVPLGGLPK